MGTKMLVAMVITGKSMISVFTSLLFLKFKKKSFKRMINSEINVSFQSCFKLKYYSPNIISSI